MLGRRPAGGGWMALDVITVHEVLTHVCLSSLDGVQHLSLLHTQFSPICCSLLWMEFDIITVHEVLTHICLYLFPGSSVPFWV